VIPFPQRDVHIRDGAPTADEMPPGAATDAKGSMKGADEAGKGDARP